MAAATNDSPVMDQTKMRKYRREASKRVFVNRGLHLDKIKYFGFDMDYTIAEYISPEFETLSYELIVERLISIGYPEELRQFPYDPSFPLRGLWFDTTYGNLLKVDAYGNILCVLHGFRFLKKKEVETLYPNRFVQLVPERLFVLNTLFNLPECYILAACVNYFDQAEGYEKDPTRTGVKAGDLFMAYKSIFQDIRTTVDWVHFYGDMKRLTMQNLPKYVHKDERLPLLLDKMRSRGSKTFLLTNSGFEYTNSVMDFLLSSQDEKGIECRNWKSYFDCIVVDAQKPLWFAEGTIFRQVDVTTGTPRIGAHTGELRPGHIYSGGSCTVFNKLLGTRGKDVLYIGDHIFGDVLKSKKTRGWRTFLVVPELVKELSVWTTKKPLYDRLQDLDISLGTLYRNHDILSMDKPDAIKINSEIADVVHEMEQSYGKLGSLFRSGSRLTFFASQVERYADLYASSCCNLLYYPLFYLYRAPPMLMPHESTVAHEETSDQISSNTFATRMRQDTIDNGILASGLGDSRRASASSNSPFHSILPVDVGRESRSRPETPAHPVCVHEDDDEEECQSDESPPRGLGESLDGEPAVIGTATEESEEPGAVRSQVDKQKQREHDMVMRLTSESYTD